MTLTFPKEPTITAIWKDIWRELRENAITAALNTPDAVKAREEFIKQLSKPVNEKRFDPATWVKKPGRRWLCTNPRYPDAPIYQETSETVHEDYCLRHLKRVKSNPSNNFWHLTDIYVGSKEWVEWEQSKREELEELEERIRVYQNELSSAVKYTESWHKQTISCRNKIKELEREIAELNEPWKPKSGEQYYCVSDNGYVHDAPYTKNSFDNARIEFGNYFKTYEEACAARDALKIILPALKDEEMRVAIVARAESLLRNQRRWDNVLQCWIY